MHRLGGASLNSTAIKKNIDVKKDNDDPKLSELDSSSIGHRDDREVQVKQGYHKFGTNGVCVF